MDLFDIENDFSEEIPIIEQEPQQNNNENQIKQEDYFHKDKDKQEEIDFQIKKKTDFIVNKKKEQKQYAILDNIDV